MTNPPRFLPFGRRAALALATAALGLALLPPALARARQEPQPSPLAGEWTWSWTDPEKREHHHLLQVEGTGRTLAARETFDDEAPVRVTGLTFDGENVVFKVARGGREADYRGKLVGRDTINGRVKTMSDGQGTEHPWTATRKKQKPAPTPSPNPPNQP